jgi:hypothetical protein
VLNVPDPRRVDPAAPVEPSGPIAFTSIDKGPEGTVAYDHVEGSLQGNLLRSGRRRPLSPAPFESVAVAATRWEHVHAKPVLDTDIYGWRGELDGDPAAVFLLPEVLLGFESTDAKHHGGFLGLRGSHAWPFTRYALPAGPGRSAMVTFDMREHARRRWVVRPSGAQRRPVSTSMAIVASQTSVEAEPRVYVLIFGG